MPEKLSGLKDNGRYLASRSQQSLLKVPPVVFGAPRQLARELHTSWEYVPVYIQPQSLHKKALAHCRVKLISFGDDRVALDMRWVELNGKDSADQITLLGNQLYFVPIAARSEPAANRHTIITDESFIARKKVVMQLRAGKSRWSLRVENSEGKQESSLSYELTVPPPDQGNGHFTLEARHNTFTTLVNSSTYKGTPSAPIMKIVVDFASKSARIAAATLRLPYPLPLAWFLAIYPTATA